MQQSAHDAHGSSYVLNDRISPHIQLSSYAYTFFSSAIPLYLLIQLRTSRYHTNAFSCLTIH